MTDMLPRPSDYYVLPLDDGIEWLVKDLLVPTLRPFFRALQWPVDQILGSFEAALLAIPFLVFLAVGSALAWRVAGRNVAVFTGASLLFLDLAGIWDESMTTLSMVLTAVLFCAVVGVPLGIWAGRSDRFAAGVRPVLDIMQTTPAFVYLVPVVMLFGVGMVPGVIATIVFSMPPIIRLTNLGIRQVSGELVEAGHAFGATPRQILLEIQIPLAMRAILAGLNQTLMLSLSMVVIAALIGAEGLGLVVFQGIGRLDVGLAALGGIGIVLIAIVLDRLTQAVGGSAGEPRSFRAALATLFGRRRPGSAEEGAGEPHSHGA